MSDQVALWSDKAQAAIKRLFSYIPDMSYTDYIIIDRWHAIIWLGLNMTISEL